MVVPMMNIRVVWVIVRERLVLMLMSVGLGSLPSECVGVLMMVVVPMAMRVHERLVGVGVTMALREVQPDPNGHQGSRDPEDR